MTYIYIEKIHDCNILNMRGSIFFFSCNFRTKNNKHPIAKL